MSLFSKQTITRELEAKVDAIDKSQAVIEFDMNGIILIANSNFLGAMGYTLDEIVGKHHSIFVDAATKSSDEYRQFWANLNRGEFQSAQYKRFGKGGREIWIEASYNPIFDTHNKPYKVVKFATDITKQKVQEAEYLGKVNALNRSQAVIEGEVLNLLEK
jgi:methyl-accepting chemotaxis protein